MLHQDYITRMLMELAAAVTRCVLRAENKRAPLESAELLEEAVGNAVAIDGASFLALAPESIAQIMQVTGTDPRVSEYVARSVMLAAKYLEEAGDTDLAQVRRAQALAIADAYGHDISDMDGSLEDAGSAATEAMAEYAAME